MLCSNQQWLSLIRARGVGNRTLLPLILQSESLEALIQNAPQAVNEKLTPALQLSDSEIARQIEQDLLWLEKPDNHLITISDSRYPDLLRQIPDAPIALFIHGDADLLSLPQLAIVGSRNPGKTGKDNAFAFARHLAACGLGITSGMAMGIDAQAHLGCLDAAGKTLAVLGTGPDRVYPANHHKLAHRIAEQGAIVSEFPPGTEPKAGNFPRRNRIISGLSLGTLVVEATIKSGSLITANFAVEQGREVFAIPGSIHNPQSKGCHKLIKQGARLIESAQDIMDELGALISTYLPDIDAETGLEDKDSLELDKEYQLLLEHMGWDPVSVETLIQVTKFPVESVSSMLLLLELQGHVSSAPGGYYIRTQPSN